MLGVRLPEMTAPDSGSAAARHRWFRVEDPAAAAFLVEADLRGYVTPFLGAATSVSDAARQLGSDLDTVYYRVRRMHSLGIVRVSDQRARAGRPIKHYATPAEGLFIPFSATPAATLEELILAGNARLDDQLVRGLVDATWEMIDDPQRWGFRLFRDEHGRVHFDYAPEGAPDDFDLHRFMLDAGAPALLSAWTTLHLRRDDAKALQTELYELLQRYLALADATEEHTHAYLTRIAMTPLRRS